MVQQSLVPRLARSLGLAILLAVLVAPMAVCWGVTHATLRDYLGPHGVTFASTFSGEVKIDLGPVGNAYLPSQYAPLGLDIVVGGVAPIAGSDASFFSEQTLLAYTGIYAEPGEAIAGVLERLSGVVALESVKAEMVGLGLVALWLLRRRLFAPWLARAASVRRVAVGYIVVLAVVVGSILAPGSPAPGARVAVSVSLRTPFTGLQVDSLLLSDLLDRGIKGVSVLVGRQQQVASRYVTSANDAMLRQFSALPRPGTGETMLLGLSDLHCNQAMTTLISRMVAITKPSQILSSGDDTVNGTAAERGCITREAGIASGVPFVVAGGNHDSDVTESQMRKASMTVLDGAVLTSGGLSLLGDDDPDRNLPFSVDRVKDRAESEEQLGARMVDVARGRQVDVIMVHQPAASAVIMAAPEPPARLVLWGHFHAQDGPTVVTHEDGSWTVGMQEGTAGGVREPTFTSFSTPFSPPLVRADTYFYFRDDATGLITGVQSVHFLPDATVVVDSRVATGNLAALPADTRARLGQPTQSVTPSGTPSTPR